MTGIWQRFDARLGRGHASSGPFETTGRVVNEPTLGPVIDQAGNTVLGESGDAQGQTVLRVRDAAGAVIELTLDTAAHVVCAGVVSPAPGTTR